MPPTAVFGPKRDDRKLPNFFFSQNFFLLKTSQLTISATTFQPLPFGDITYQLRKGLVEERRLVYFVFESVTDLTIYYENSGFGHGENFSS